MMKPLTTEEMNLKLAERNLIIVGEYRGSNSSHVLKCLECGFEKLYLKINNYKNLGCRNCYVNNQKIKNGENTVDEILAKKNMTRISEYRGYRNPLTIVCNTCGNRIYRKTANSLESVVCRHCNKLICIKCNKEFVMKGYLNRNSKTVRKLCYDCAPSNDKNLYQRTILEERKKILIERYGSECQMCGYNKFIAALEFHHKNPNEKECDIRICLKKNLDLESFFSELDKCILVCSNCHREIHYNLNRLNES